MLAPRCQSDVPPHSPLPLFAPALFLSPAYSGVPLVDVLRQRGEHFNAELLRLDALEDVQVRGRWEGAGGGYIHD